MDQGHIRTLFVGQDRVVGVGDAGNIVVPVSAVLLRIFGDRIARSASSAHVSVRPVPPSWLARAPQLVLFLVPFAYLAIVWRFMQRLNPAPKGDVGKSVSQRGRPAAARLPQFDDVAGVDAAKAELVEIVDFVKRPERYARLGARFPKGVLLFGASGTGKTMLAKAIAREAGVSFISCSASDFVETFVGRGAARIRDIFRRAAQSAPCVLFIDELDAVGQKRDRVNGSEEREQTLNQLLIEMDGFDSADGVIVLAATNRPQVLDRALLRSGRFDRHVRVPAPDLAGRAAVLGVHLRAVRTGSGLDVTRVAAATEGFSGAELACLVNEAALLAVRAGATEVAQTHLEAALAKMAAASAVRHGTASLRVGARDDALQRLQALFGTPTPESPRRDE